MRTERVMYFTEKEEGLVDLLIKTGIRRNVAKVLVFLANVPESTSRAIERGTDLRQPEVSLAMQYLTGLDWIICKEQRATTKGRPMKVYGLSKPVPAIVDHIICEKKRETNAQLARVKKLQEYIG